MAGTSRSPGIAAAAATAALIVGQMIAAKATRDALFLGSFDVELLPRMVVIAALVSAAVTLGTTRLRVRSDPHRLTGVLSIGSAVVLAALHALSARAPQAVAAAFYLYTMSLGPLIATSFWSAINEALDPDTAKSAVGKISAGGIAGAVVGGVAVERVGSFARVETMLLVLAAASLVTVASVALLPRPDARRSAPDAEASERGLRLLVEHPLLRAIAVLVALGVLGSALLDYAFKALAAGVYRDETELLRFFAGYYVATSGASFALQVGLGRRALEKLGVVRTVGALPLSAMIAGGVGLVAGGLMAATVARALEGVVRASLYRSGYELLYTPVATVEKRAAKPLIEIVVDRASEALGGALIAACVFVLPAHVTTLCFTGAIACGAGAWLAARRLRSGYVGALADQLESLGSMSAGALLPEGTLTFDARAGLTAYRNGRVDPAPAAPRSDLRVVTLMNGLLSSDIEIVRRTLGEARPLDARLVAAVIPLLDDPDVKSEAAGALRESGARHAGQLADVLADSKVHHHALRARVARLLGDLDGPRVVDALVVGLADPRFEVRLASGRSLLMLRDRGQTFDARRFFDLARQEIGRWSASTEASRAVGPEDSAGDAFAALVADRSERTLEHLFRLFALVLPREAIERAFKGVLSDDRLARGTALEYLENVLPPDVWAEVAPALAPQSRSQ
jgi:hypothetical protein